LCSNSKIDIPGGTEKSTARINNIFYRTLMIYDTKLARLKVIPAGYGSLNPAEILSDIKLTELLERLKQNYDVVIIDTPPIVFVSEIFQLREIIDFNIIVVRHHQSSVKTGLGRNKRSSHERKWDNFQQCFRSSRNVRVQKIRLQRLV
jgi:MinD-like ATPase involved in chromosome partitioning or flagellar assembly